MTFLAPGFLLAGALGAVAVVLLHFIVTREPHTVPLPTTRFVPDRPIEARARAFHLEDLLLLACRATVLLLAGAALARPVVTPSRHPLTRIVLADFSRAAQAAEVGDSVRALAGSADRVIPLDSLGEAGRISVGLIRALRTASELRERTDSFELAVVSPLPGASFDAATDSLRALWPGAIRVVPVELRRDSVAHTFVEIEGAPDDPLRFALPPLPAGAVPNVRVVRDTPAAADSAWARDSLHALVHWPRTWGSTGDTAHAVIAGPIVVVAPFDGIGSLSVAAGWGVLARWINGRPAAIERRTAGCLRTVAIPVPSRGDLVLDARFQQLVGVLTAPCGAKEPLVPVDSSRRNRLAGSALPARVARAAIPRTETVPSPLMPWLLAGAMGLAVLELGVRRRTRRIGASP